MSLTANSLDENATRILEARHHDPFSYLGPHRLNDGRLVVRALQPQAHALDIVLLDGGGTFSAELLHPNGLYEAYLPADAWGKAYEILWHTHEGKHVQHRDAYSFGMCLGDLDMHLFREGRHWRLFEHLGAHPKIKDGVSGMQFAVWAPNAKRVSVTGDFNCWDGRVHSMRLRMEGGIWELFIPHIGPGAHYKFELLGAHGQLFNKSDPFAFFAQNGPQTASLTWDFHLYQWQDAEWMQRRPATDPYHAPMSIYEVHLGSWKRGENNRPLSYNELADQLIPYVKQLGFTHIELMPVSEFPFDGSWGYQVGGYYAPTSRFGNPDQFRHFVDRCHQENIGVIVDWVPAHFPKDAHGLARFDGTALYEHADPRQGEHMDWGTLIFNYGRNEVRNFLIANALFWLEHYHIDGIRVDAVASMLYLDYSREQGEWVPNVHGGRENLEAIAFMKELNLQCYTQHPGVMMIAEESTSWGGVSRPVASGGLGFGFKWNMGWMNDTLKYMEKEPIHRKYHHGEATFSMLYAYDENFILVLSHDEVVHGKHALLDKMPGDRWQKFANLRMFLGWMWTHPGKKLLFMGCEIGQWREWSHERQLDWEVLFGEEHRGLQKLVADLNHLYTSRPSLHRRDHENGGFRWLDANDWENSLFVYVREEPTGDQCTVLVNATPVPRQGYRLGVSQPGTYRELLNTDSGLYSGANMGNGAGLNAEPTPWQGQPYSVVVTVPPLATVIIAKE
ncbi:1,4-alpha-glucan branching protein GlgB [Roseimicrobium sp. ORNL1]|uniref:1,4-alpha-glucan branching protein GlgB n=1 Tax=Roseimicrobium sp. ORNL1 TaxID=2711231 RepID=UPI0013E13BB0|nr:1,4-alpha-glucan branching protein GlgB [Roseimicrobium sp. ORNL1]QIF03369.1 1,4-alpha-glucan branching protein GlgB [Roseimicrobium sp. ORNL1]